MAAVKGEQRDRKELTFFEHLDELRFRLVRVVAYVVVGAVAGWYYRVPLLDMLRYPAEHAAQMVGVENLPFRVFEPAAGFVIAVQVALLAGVIAASPLIIIETWRFVEPALENSERRYAILILPAAIALFLGGVVFCYFVSPNAFAFLFRIDQSLGVEVERTLRPYLWFMMRLLLAFGLAFELPLVLMFLGFIGVVNHRQLLGWWRHAVVIIFVFAALVTPTVDPVNMSILAGPMILLYLASIVLVRFVQRTKKSSQDEQDETDDAAATDSEVDQFYAGTSPEDAEGVSSDDDAQIPAPEDDLIEGDFTAEDPQAPATEDDLAEGDVNAQDDPYGLQGEDSEGASRPEDDLTEGDFAAEDTQPPAAEDDLAEGDVNAQDDPYGLQGEDSQGGLRPEDEQSSDEPPDEE